jgi:hypothetical protein
MTNLEIAKDIQKAYKLLLDKTSWKATTGSHKAACDVISQMTSYHLALKAFGYMTNDEGKLVKYKPRVLSEYEQLVMNTTSGKESDAQKLLDYIYTHGIQ